uniref:glutathione transferase n=1 Tax=Panagrellus redivivus TaxID=6233 RepID=A0A7E4W668_PANRE
MSTIQLTYFDTRGIAETARLLLKYGKIDFEDVRIKPADWPALKDSTPTGKVPYLKVGSEIIVESNAINRFIAKRVGLAGKDEFEQAHVDAAADIVKDFYAAVAPWFYVAKGYREGDAASLKVEHFDKNVKLYLPLFQNLLKEANSGFLVKSGVTWADFVLTEFLLSLYQVDPTFLNEYPDLKEYLARIRTVPELKEYYATRPEH